MLLGFLNHNQRPHQNAVATGAAIANTVHSIKVFVTLESVIWPIKLADICPSPTVKKNKANAANINRK